jgi:hypothetical protein
LLPVSDSASTSASAARGSFDQFFGPASIAAA